VKPFLLFYLLHLTFLFAENQDSLTYNNNSAYQLAVEDKLTTILEKIKIYKSVKEKEIQTLKKKLANLANIEKKFKRYKKTKQKELKLLKHQLKTNNQKLTKCLNPQIPITTIIPSETPQSQLTVTNVINENVSINKIIKNNTSAEKLPWIKITVRDNLNIYDLALKYYGDAQQYEKIYTANQDIIGQDYQIKNGMQLRLPMTESFEKTSYILK